MLVLQKTKVTGTYYYTDKNKGGSATASIKRAKHFKSELDIDNYFNKVADGAKLPEEWERARKEIRDWRKYHVTVEV